MKIVADLHCHTIASTHSHGTMQEMVAQARKLGYHALAITDHGTGIPDSPHKWYFGGLPHLPDVLDGDFLLLKGVEANAMDLRGTLDMKDSLMAKLDWVICSLHRDCVAPQQEVTDLWLRVAENPLVDMIGHPENGAYPFDYDRVARAFARHGKVVEMNAGSAKTRPGNEANMRRLALCCKEHGVKIAVNSDAHSVWRMDILQPVLEMLEAIGFPEELVINTSMGRLLAELALHGRDVALRVTDTPFGQKYTVEKPQGV